MKLVCQQRMNPDWTSHNELPTAGSLATARRSWWSRTAPRRRRRPGAGRRSSRQGDRTVSLRKEKRRIEGLLWQQRHEGWRRCGGCRRDNWPTVTPSATSSVYVRSSRSFSVWSPKVKKATPLFAFAAAISWIRAATTTSSGQTGFILTFLYFNVFMLISLDGPAVWLS